MLPAISLEPFGLQRLSHYSCADRAVSCCV